MHRRHRLLQDEVERRDSKQTEVRMRRANFEGTKRLEDFEFTFNPKVPKQRIIDLAACHFVEKKANVLLIGPTGVGKSHLAQAIGERACRAGNSVLFITAQRLFAQLRGSRADQSYEKKLLRFTTPDLLVIDDLGLRPLEREEPLDLYEIRGPAALGSCRSAFDASRESSETVGSPEAHCSKDSLARHLEPRRMTRPKRQRRPVLRCGSRIPPPTMERRSEECSENVQH